jgi:hypothetical protein
MTLSASILDPDGHGHTRVRHDTPDEVGTARAATPNGFVVETKDDLNPTVRVVSHVLVARSTGRRAGPL